LFIIIALTIVIGCVVLIGGLYLWFYFDQFIIPLNPSARGDFPADPVWVYQADDRIVSTPVIQDSLVFLRTPKSIIALDPANGKQVWRVDSHIPMQLNEGDLTIAPVVNEDYLVVAEEGSGLGVFSNRTGQLEWRTPGNKTFDKTPLIGSIEAYAIAGDKLFVARNSTFLAAYDLNSGDILWGRRVPNKAILDVETDGDVVYLSASETLQGIDPSTGEVLWERDFASIITNILLDGNTLYVLLPFGSESLVALDLNTLQEIWSIASTEFNDEELRTILPAGDVLYFGGDRLYALSEGNGSKIWESEETGPLEQPLVIDNKVIVRNKDKELFLFEAGSGERIGSLGVRINTLQQRSPERSPAAFGDLLIVPFGDRRVFAYQP
jgi:outer membrane protein assembly factor BamB